MYSSYSPGESNQEAVVPRSYQGSPTSVFADDFSCSPPPTKLLCLDRGLDRIPTTSASTFNYAADFADFAAAIAADQALTASSSAPPSSSTLSPESSSSPFGGDFPGAGGYGYDAMQQHDSKDGLANYLQSAGAAATMQHQQPQQRQGRLGMDMATPPLRNEEYSIVVHQQPEEYYRARYETEGIRGPMKGRENNHPAVRVIGPMTYSGVVRVSLVHEDGTKHTSCFLDETKDRQKALTKKIDPQSNMIVEFEDLRIRRETKSKNYSKEGGRKADKTKSARNDKTACLCFTATLQLAPNQEITLQVLSKPIQLCAPPEGAELEWLIPEYGHANGDEKIVIKGTKMTCPKVTFTVMLPDAQVVELLGHVDKEQSHQNVLVVKTPRLPDDLRNYQGPTLKAEVRVSSGRAGTCSAPLPFYYIPNGVCHTCKQTLPPAPLPMSIQPHTIGIAAYPGIYNFTGSIPQQQCGSVPSLPPFQEMQPQVTYPPRQCQQEQMVNTLSHPPSISAASTPSPIPAPPAAPSTSRRDSFQQFLDSPPPSTTTAASSTPRCTHSPNISPTSSPGPWNPGHLGHHLVPMNTVQGAILANPDFQTLSTSSLVTSPGSEPVYSAVPSPDTTTSIYQPMIGAYLEDTTQQYRQFTP